MTKITLALAAALLAGTTMTSAANAGGIRLGFGFPLGSFVAHQNQGYSGGGYGGRHYDKPRYAARRSYDEAPARKVAKVKRAPQIDVAEATKTVTPVVKTAKLEDKLTTNEATTTEIAKTSTTDTTNTASTTTTTTPAPVKAETSATDKVANVVKSATNGKSDLETGSVPAQVKQVCRRYSAAIASLVDVPCE